MSFEDICLRLALMQILTDNLVSKNTIYHK